MSIAELEIAPRELYGLVAMSVMALLVIFEWSSGKYREGRKNLTDWKMFGLSTAGVSLVERPLMAVTVYFLASSFIPEQQNVLRAFESANFWMCLIAFWLVDEFLHGLGHNFAHKKAPRNRLLAKVHSFYREAHRGHHQLGGADGKGELSVTQTTVAGWGWLTILPNAWFGLFLMYLGFIETWFWGTIVKSIWGMHVHTNWKYDLYLLNHPNRWVSRSMYALCHVFTFPNQHHQHHSRSQNSAKNMQNFLALFDWLCWGTLAIEKKRPDIYGWRQSEKEQGSLYRYFYRGLKTARG